MAGRMGGSNVTTFNLQVYKIDTERNLVYLLGAVPGPQGGIVRMVDSKKATTAEQMEALYDLPMPTWVVRVCLRPFFFYKPDQAGLNHVSLFWCAQGEEEGDVAEVLMPLGAVDPLRMDGIG